jgi:DNA polymerase/3'-5' exonuclease PolX
MNPTTIVGSGNLPHKPRFPRELASSLANQLVDRMEPLCRQILVCGSLRRHKAFVGDIEIVYIPLLTPRQNPVSLLEDIQHINLADQFLEQAIRDGWLAKRKNIKGSDCWGDKNKLAVLTRSGIPVDFFATTQDAWASYIVCRTGGAETNKAICFAAIERGWKWHPYDGYFSNRNNPDERHIITSEEEVFRFVGLPFLDPWKRK